MTGSSPPELRLENEQLLYREAELMDVWNVDEWFRLRRQGRPKRSALAHIWGDSMLYHTVLIKFSEETSKEVIDDALEHLRAMIAIPAVRAVAAGPNVFPLEDSEWTHGLTLVFDSVEAMMADFMDHPMHQTVMRDQRPLFSEIMAMDVESS